MAETKFNYGDVVLVVRIKKTFPYNRITYSAAAFTLNNGCMVFFQHINPVENEEEFKRSIAGIQRDNNVYIVCNYADEDCEKCMRKFIKSLKKKPLITFHGTKHDRVKGALIIARNIYSKGKLGYVYPIKELADDGVTPSVQNRKVSIHSIQY